MESNAQYPTSPNHESCVTTTSHASSGHTTSDDSDCDNSGNIKNTSNDQVHMSSLEPRTIEEMVDPLEPLPLWWYDWCPSMTPTQQVLMEYSMPATLPAKIGRAHV